MQVVNLLIVCLISQGSKGEYLTYLRANAVDKINYYYVTQLKPDTGKEPKGLPIAKKHCRIVFDYEAKKLGSFYK